MQPVNDKSKKNSTTYIRRQQLNEEGHVQFIDKYEKQNNVEDKDRDRNVSNVEFNKFNNQDSEELVCHVNNNNNDINKEKDISADNQNTNVNKNTKNKNEQIRNHTIKDDQKYELNEKIKQNSVDYKNTEIEIKKSDDKKINSDEFQEKIDNSKIKIE